MPARAKFGSPPTRVPDPCATCGNPLGNASPLCRADERRALPDETKEWGRAFAAELPEIQTPFESLHWLIGGIMLLRRERLRHAVKSLARRTSEEVRARSSASAS